MKKFQLQALRADAHTSPMNTELIRLALFYVAFYYIFSRDQRRSNFGCGAVTGDVAVGKEAQRDSCLRLEQHF